MNFEYGKASPAVIEQLWAQTIREHPGDNRFITWRQEFVTDNRQGLADTFAVICDGRPVGEGTLLYSPDCSAVRGRTQLADSITVANINALRIQTPYEGQGHISHLVREMEAQAWKKGFTHLTIGVEAREARNLGIYLHWGYRTLVMWEIEEDALVLYYRKALNG